VRIALISLIAPADDEPRTPLGLLELAGRSLASRQLDLALHLGCERVICVAGGLDRPVIALQHQAEAAGASFNLIAGPRPLLGLVGAGDELLGFADGLLASAAEAQAALAGKSGVLVVSVEPGIAAGFERIDLNHAWAGMFSMPGRLVGRLTELPPDCDAVSALLRIALQGKVPERILPEAVLGDARWAMVQSQAQLAGLEPDWFRRHAAPLTPFAPGRALARLAMRAWGAWLLGRRVKPWMLAQLGAVFAGVGVAAAFSGLALAGIGLCGFGWVLVECGEALRPMARDSTGGERLRSLDYLARGFVLDITFVAVLALPLAGGWPARLFAALVLMGLVRLAERLIGPKWAEFLQDRAVLAVVLAAAMQLGVLPLATQVLSLLLLAALLGFIGRQSRLTQT
jgi:hypothetical protein